MVVIVVIILLTTAGVRAADGDVYATGFEGDYEELCPGWDQRHWGYSSGGVDFAGHSSSKTDSIIVQYAKDSRHPHAGQAAQKIACLRKHTGSTQIVCREKFKLLADRDYTLRVWLRGKSLPADKPVRLLVRTAEVQDEDREYRPGQAPRVKGEVHLERACSVSSTWQEFILSGRVKYDCNADILIGFDSIGAIWVDDLSISAGVPADADARPFQMQGLAGIAAALEASSEPPRKGNRLYNGSFEAGAAGWGPLRWERLDPGNRHRHIRTRVEKTDAPHGQHALCVDSTEELESEYVQVRPGQPLTLSAHLKADKEPVGVGVSFLDGAMVRYDRYASHTTNVNLTTNWQRVVISGLLPPSANNGIVVRFRASGAYWIDAVQLEEGALTDFAPAADVELGTVWADSNTGIYRPGQTAKVRLHAGGPPARKLPVESQLEDFHGHVRLTLRTPVTLDDHGHATADLAVKLPAPGIYRLLSAVDGAARPAELILAQVERPKVACGGVQTGLERFGLDFVKDTGFRWWRLLDFYNPLRWSEVEPQPGQFVFDDSNALDDLRSTGVQLVGTLYDTPDWAGKRDPQQPTTLASQHWGAFSVGDWTNYVHTVVRHSKDRIRAWEIWNEPGESFSPEHLFRLHKEAYTAIKQEDPGACVVGGGGATLYATPHLDRFFSLGALNYMDAYSWHGYAFFVEHERGDSWQFGRGIRDLMKKHGKIVPFWDTEWGVSCLTFRRVSFFGGQSLGRDGLFPYRAAVRQVLRHQISGRALGMEADQWYNANGYSSVRNNEAWLTTLVEFDGSPRATVGALANAWDVLGETELVEMLQPNPIVRLYTFRHPDGALFAVDNKLPESFSAQLILSVNQSGERINVMGERTSVRPRGNSLALTMDAEPFFVLFRGASPALIAEAAKRADLVGLLPADLSKLLTIDHTSEPPLPIRGANYETEIVLGAGLQGWRFRKGGEAILVFAGTGAPSARQTITVNNAEVQLFDSLGHPLIVRDGQASIVNGAPYFVTGNPPENAIGTTK